MSEVKELALKNDCQERRTLVSLDDGRRFVVSTVKLAEGLDFLDDMLDLVNDLAGIDMPPAGNEDGETLVFPCDHDGEPTSWTQVAGVRGIRNHDALLEQVKDWEDNDDSN